MKRTRGFTLLEMLVALAIAALAITGWLSLQGDFSARWLGSEELQRAAALGADLTDRLGRDLPLGDQEGRAPEFGGLRWSLRVVPLDGDIPVGSASWHLHSYSLAIGHDLGRPVLTLKGRRLARNPERNG
ncbi:prepilin-type N-terminal cleavage/methylation domain-containing protein [Ferrovibrio sp.]|uniref:prepilin-type N-terminal cleavage/methylation domain-containing protein n=1 Tax=Ferrovibrio sp. TaxID=1917215 RepID=UPI003D127EF7